MPTNYLSFSQRSALETLLRATGKSTSLDFDGTTNFLNAPQKVPNPTPQGDVPQAITFGQITAGLEASTVAKLSGNGLIGEFKAAVDTQNHARIDAVIDWWTKGSVLTEGELSTLTALTSATMPDPSWQPTVDGLSLFAQAMPNFYCVIDGTGVSQCHPLLVKEAMGVS